MWDGMEIMKLVFLVYLVVVSIHLLTALSNLAPKDIGGHQQNLMIIHIIKQLTQNRVNMMMLIIYIPNKDIEEQYQFVALKIKY